MTSQELHAAIRETKPNVGGIIQPIQCLLRHPPVLAADASPRVPHYHEYIELLFGLDGCELKVWIGGKWVQLGQGDLLVINAETPHTFAGTHPAGAYICVKVLPELIYFSENPLYDVKYAAPFLQQTLVNYRFFPEAGAQDGRVERTMREMLRVFEERPYGFEIELKSLFLRLFLWLVRRLHDDEEAMFEPPADISVENVRLIQQAAQFIRENLTDVTEAQAAANANLSYSYFSRLFRRVMGKNFHEYLTAVRINEAERMLLSGDRPITEIALATGFASSSHFIVKFKKYRKKTPKQYRMQAQK